MIAIFWKGPRDGFKFTLPTRTHDDAPSEIRLPLLNSPGFAVYRSRLHGGFGRAQWKDKRGVLHMKIAAGRDCVHYDFVCEEF